MCTSTSLDLLAFFLLEIQVVNSDGTKLHLVEVQLNFKLLANLFSQEAHHFLSTSYFSQLLSLSLADATTMLIAAKDLSAARKQCDLVGVVELPSYVPNVAFNPGHFIERSLFLVLIEQEILTTCFDHAMASDTVKDEEVVLRAVCELLPDAASSFCNFAPSWVGEVICMVRVFELEALQHIFHINAICLDIWQIRIETRGF